MPNSSFNGREPQMCALCGNLFPKLPFISLVDGQYIQYCDRCNQLLYSCRTCAHRPTSKCPYFASDSTLPLYVQKVTEIGPVRQIKQVFNPERMAITCTACECYQDGDCQAAKSQENGTNCCEKHHLRTTP